MAYLQEDISDVVNDEHKGPDSGEVARPAESHERDGGHVMDEHLPEVLPLHVEELRNAERPVEAQLDHVVPPDVTGDTMVRVMVPAELDIPEPLLRPKGK